MFVFYCQPLVLFPCLLVKYCKSNTSNISKLQSRLNKNDIIKVILDLHNFLAILKCFRIFVNAVYFTLHAIHRIDAKVTHPYPP